VNSRWPILRWFELRGNPFSGNCGRDRTDRLADNPYQRWLFDRRADSSERRTHGSRNGNGRGFARYVRWQHHLLLLQGRALDAPVAAQGNASRVVFNILRHSRKARFCGPFAFVLFTGVSGCDAVRQKPGYMCGKPLAVSGAPGIIVRLLRTGSVVPRDVYHLERTAA